MRLELLAPARNAEQGILAFRCGADAVYVGGDRFGARQGAACDLSDIERLCSEARLWGGRVYAALNTLLFDEDLDAARDLAWRVYEAGVDALILQDMAFLEMDLPPLPLHASTQAACDGPEKVAFLASVGFRRAILARELSLAEIRAVRAATDIELESFVFGALCVGESGRCYLSGALCGRSGNRGACAQPCRSTWDLLDGAGRTLLRGRHLLSIQDLDLSAHLEDLALAGVSSFKIEGRLKDADYVKNVVSYLRRRLDELLDRTPGTWAPASLGRARRDFEPDPRKTFQRGLGIYRLDGQRRPLGTPDAAGHLGSFVGQVRAVQGDRLVLDRAPDLSPGDGLACLDDAGGPSGTAVNAVEGRQVRVQDPSGIRPGSRLYRNRDHAWIHALRTARVVRRIPVRARLDVMEGALRLTLTDPEGRAGVAERPGDFPPSQDPDATRAALREAMGRLGNTPFELSEVEWDGAPFAPLSLLNALRREAAARLEAARRAPRTRAADSAPLGPPRALPEQDLDLRWNVANRLARTFYARHGARTLEPAAELRDSLAGEVLMTTRHCLRYELGWCPEHPLDRPWVRLSEPVGPLFLQNGDTRLRCRFDCGHCRMELLLEPLQEREKRRPGGRR